jgi:hypothetical protein
MPIDMSLFYIMAAAIPLAYFIGTIYGDPYQRCKYMRRIFKAKRYAVINLISEGRTIVRMVLSLEGFKVETKDCLWQCDNDRIYNDKGIIYDLKKEHIEKVAGVPALFLDYDSFRPLIITGEKTKPNPREFYAINKAWLITKEAELMRLKQNQMILLIAILALCAVIGFLVYDVDQQMNTNGKIIKDISARISAPATQTPGGQTVDSGTTVSQG